MKKDNQSENVIPFTVKKRNSDTQIVKPCETKIIDLFTSKKLLEEAKFDKKHSNRFYLNGRSLFYSENYERAFENLKKAEESGCYNTDLYILLSRCYGIKNDIKSSEMYAKKAIDTDKDCAEAYYLALLGQVTQNKVSLETLKFAVKAIMCGFEADDMVYYYAALFFMNDSHSNFKKAKKHIMSAIDHIQYGIEQDKRENIVDYDKQRKLIIYYQIKADACFYLKEYGEAFTLYTTCEKNNMIEISIFLNKSIIYYERQEYENALKYINLAFKFYDITHKKDSKELFEYINYIKALILSHLNDESFLEYLKKSGKFFKEKKLLKQHQQQVKKIEELEQSQQENIKALRDEVIKIILDCKSEKDFQECFLGILNSIGIELLTDTLNHIETQYSENEKLIEFVKYAKEKISNK